MTNQEGGIILLTTVEEVRDRTGTRRRKAIIAALILLLVGAVAGIAFVYWPRKASPRPTGKIDKKVDLPPPTVPPPPPVSPLTGLPTTADRMTRRPLAIMIENHTAARPQSGLDKADLIYEVVAEGGITRFMAVFMSQDAASIGPIRSAREYYVELARQFAAVYVHVGGSPGGFATIRRLGVADLDEFANGPAFSRIRTRKAPHNLYSSTDRLWERAKMRGYMSSAYAGGGPLFKIDAPLEARPQTASVNINFSGSRYRVKWVYDRGSNSYLRLHSDGPHRDAVTGAQLSARNLMVQYTSIRAADRVGRVDVNVIGSGSAIVFSDGRAAPATWKRASASDMTRFFDAAGQEIKLNPGRTWISIIDRSRPATYESTPK